MVGHLEPLRKFLLLDHRCCAFLRPLPLLSKGYNVSVLRSKLAHKSSTKPLVIKFRSLLLVRHALRSHCRSSLDDGDTHAPYGSSSSDSNMHILLGLWCRYSSTAHGLALFISLHKVLAFPNVFVTFSPQLDMVQATFQWHILGWLKESQVETWPYAFVQRSHFLLIIWSSCCPDIPRLCKFLQCFYALIYFIFGILFNKSFPC